MPASPGFRVSGSFYIDIPGKLVENITTGRSKRKSRV
jgi:hypothetical protein